MHVQYCIPCVGVRSLTGYLVTLQVRWFLLHLKIIMVDTLYRQRLINDPPIEVVLAFTLNSSCVKYVTGSLIHRILNEAK
jgi:hypothetical protein